MSFADERAAIENRLKTQLAADTDPTIQALAIAFENTTIDPSVLTEYVTCIIKETNNAAIAALGTTQFRFSGIIINSVMVKDQTGTQRARKIADSISKIWRLADFVGPGNAGRIQGRVPYVIGVGVKNGWYQLDVTTPFIRDVVL